ncbi:MAG: pyridoxal phosphate-dependent aminotransferase [Alphaproteobacteria bacterium HGW-Alphaproteobacteria-18]|nr:MAG: pyridoxal phosphate-dependent aminotransferase [Alphaproteobacteria bacterium HGW-Alphaproteobacteria-18]
MARNTDDGRKNIIDLKGKDYLTVDASDSSNENVLSFAHWVRDMLTLMRSGNPGTIALFESSVPEPVDMLGDVIRTAFRDGFPSSYKSVFMRNNPDVGEHLAARYGVPEESILCTTGATTAIDMIYTALLSPGDRILVETPGFDIFANMARDHGVHADFYRREGPDFDISVDGILEALHPDTRMVVLTNLHNPSGVYVSDVALITLARVLAQKGVLLVLDEVYRDYLDSAGPGLDPAEHDNVLRISSLTKIFGLSTLRCGWIIAGQALLRRLRDYSERADFNVSRLSHCVAAEVLARADLFDQWRNDMMNAARPVAAAALGEMAGQGLIHPGVTLQGCTCFPQLIGVEDTRSLSQWLSAKHGVVVVPGECFSTPGYLRVGYGLPPERLGEGLARLARGLAEYRASGQKRHIA